MALESFRDESPVMIRTFAIATQSSIIFPRIWPGATRPYSFKLGSASPTESRAERNNRGIVGPAVKKNDWKKLSAL